MASIIRRRRGLLIKALLTIPILWLLSILIYGGPRWIATSESSSEDIHNIKQEKPLRPPPDIKNDEHLKFLNSKHLGDLKMDSEDGGGVNRKGGDRGEKAVEVGDVGEVKPVVDGRAHDTQQGVERMKQLTKTYDPTAPGESCNISYVFGSVQYRPEYVCTHMHTHTHAHTHAYVPDFKMC